MLLVEAVVTAPPTLSPSMLGLEGAISVSVDEHGSLGSVAEEIAASVQKPGIASTGVFIISATLLCLLFVALVGFRIHLHRRKFLEPRPAGRSGLSNAPSSGLFRSTAMAVPEENRHYHQGFRAVDGYGGDEEEYGLNNQHSREYRETDSLLGPDKYGSTSHQRTVSFEDQCDGNSNSNSNRNSSRGGRGRDDREDRRADIESDINSALAEHGRDHTPLRAPLRPQAQTLAAAAAATSAMAKSAGGAESTPQSTQSAPLPAHHSSPITPVSAALSSMRDTTRDSQPHFASVAKVHDGANAGVDVVEALARFTRVLREGVVVKLYTQKGPKPVLFTMAEGEVRWQAASNANKRYKLSVGDITTIETGKKTSNFLKVGTAAAEESCLSILTSRTTLDLEVASVVDRDCLVIGFREAIAEHHRISSSNSS